MRIIWSYSLVRPSMSASLLVTLLSVALSCGATAQGGDTLDSPAYRQQLCREAGSTLAQHPTGAAVARYQRALIEVQSCLDDGPATLESLWRDPMRDSANLAMLQGVTSHLRDRRLLDLMSRTAGDASRPTDVRLAAIGVLVAYYDSSLDALFPNRGTAAIRPRDFVVLGSQTHPVVNQGRQPFDQAEARRDILGLLARLAQSDADLRVRNSAEYLATYFRRGS